MKSLITLTLAVIMVGCNTANEYEIVTTASGEKVNVTEIEGCEYFKCTTRDFYYVYTHKGNCKNPIHYTSKDTSK